MPNVAKALGMVFAWGINNTRDMMDALHRGKATPPQQRMAARLIEALSEHESSLDEPIQGWVKLK